DSMGKNLDVSLPWLRAYEGSNGFWHVDDNPNPSDQFAITPDLMVNGPFSFTFKQRFSFERDPVTTGLYDGGVIEISADGGMTWTDLGLMIMAGTKYTGTLDAGNALGARMAFTAASP